MGGGDEETEEFEGSTEPISEESGVSDLKDFDDEQLEALSELSVEDLESMDDEAFKLFLQAPEKWTFEKSSTVKPSSTSEDCDDGGGPRQSSRPIDVPGKSNGDLGRGRKRGRDELGVGRGSSSVSVQPGGGGGSGVLPFAPLFGGGGGGTSSQSSETKFFEQVRLILNKTFFFLFVKNSMDLGTSRISSPWTARLPKPRWRARRTKQASLGKSL